MTDFDTFWAAFPRRTGKLDAMRAYQRARRIATADEILVGVANYKRHLPEETRYIVHPATFLNQGRWMDEYDEPQQQPRQRWCEHEPTCYSPSWHAVKIAKERGEAV